MLYCSSECGSISIMQLRTIYCNTYVHTFHVCLCLLALTFVCINSTYLLKCSFQIYQKSIVVFIRSSKVWFKTTSCAKCPVTRCNFPGNLQRNSTLKRCKLVTNVWYVKNVLANCDGNVYLPSCKLQEKLHRVTGPLYMYAYYTYFYIRDRFSARATIRSKKWGGQTRKWESPGICFPKFLKFWDTDWYFQVLKAHFIQWFVQ